MREATTGLAVDSWRQHYAGKTIAVTGATGFIGSRMVAALDTLDCRIIRIPRHHWPHAVDADVVFHFAAQTSVVEAENNPQQDFDANVSPVRSLIASCRERRTRPIILFAGTVTQAGLPSRLPVGADVPDHPVTVYDRHKLMAENELKAATLAGDVRGASLRLSNVYGPGSHGRTGDRDILNRMIRVALRGEPLTVYGAADFVRDYVFIDDVVVAFLMAACCPDAVNARHFIVGSGNGITIRAAFELIAGRVEALTGRHVPVVTAEPALPLSPIERRNFIADPSAFGAATGWRAETTLADGIDRTIEWCLCE
jgi:nucleoside-diphosphate-sugar epimerase